MDITNRKNSGFSEGELRIPKSRLRAEYLSRINRVLDHIESHLNEPLNLPDLAEVALFSPYHFHRIFSAFMGETLYSYIRRKRLEKAAALLIDKPDAAITDIALACGFSSSSAFSRAFGEHFHMSASEFRETGYTAESKTSKTEGKKRKTESKKRKASSLLSRYFGWRKPSQWRREMEIEVRDMPKMTVAYCRHVGPYSGIQQAFQKLFRWSGSGCRKAATSRMNDRASRSITTTPRTTRKGSSSWISVSR